MCILYNNFVKRKNKRIYMYVKVIIISIKVVAVRGEHGAVDHEAAEGEQPRLTVTI